MIDDANKLTNDIKAIETMIEKEKTNKIALTKKKASKTENASVGGLPQ